MEIFNRANRSRNASSMTSCRVDPWEMRRWDRASRTVHESTQHAGGVGVNESTSCREYTVRRGLKDGRDGRARAAARTRLPDAARPGPRARLRGAGALCMAAAVQAAGSMSGLRMCPSTGMFGHSEPTLLPRGQRGVQAASLLP